jgi:hypothetical protein
MQNIKLYAIFYDGVLFTSKIRNLIDSKKSKKWNTVKSVYAKEKDVKSAISNMSLKQEIKNKFKVVVFVREN